MTLTIPDEVLSSAHISSDELLVDLACYLYDKQRMSIGKATRLSGLNRIEFQKALAARDIYIKYSIEDFNTDMKNLGLSI